MPETTTAHPRRVKTFLRAVIPDRISKISSLHYFKLCFRGLLFALALIHFARETSERLRAQVFSVYGTVLLAVIAGIFILEMVLRMFPSSVESMGCEKQFKHNYIARPQGDCTVARRHMRRRIAGIAVSWIGLNGIIGGLYLYGILTWQVMVLIALFFAVSDCVCILFYCPFQALFMKNKCCGTCRIYNWDYAMMMTPLVFINHFAARLLFIMSMILLVRWELVHRRHPERFYEETNEMLGCAHCREKLCRHKKHLRFFLHKNAHLLQAGKNREY